MSFPASLISAICISILCGSINAQSDLVSLLLDLPAPPAVNTSFNPGRGADTPGFFDHRFPPHEDAPIDEILLYWKHWNEIEPGTAFTIIPSIKTVERILGEIEDVPEIATDYLNVISYYRESGYRISDILDANKHNGKLPRAKHSSLNAWIRLNSDRDIDEVEELAQKVRDSKGQPSTRAELETLARIDWSRAEPIIKKLEESKSNPISRSFGQFLRYKHAVQTGNSREAAVNIDLLQKTVENRETKPEVRDFALAALARAGDFPGKDEWYFSLLEDETLSDIEFSEQKLAGLTSFIIHSPPEKYVDKMVFLAKSPLLITRNAAVRNLAELLKHNDPRVIRAMIPWLYQKDWVGFDTKHREALIWKLQSMIDHQSVPGLLAVLEEMNEEVNRIDEPENPYNEDDVKRVKASSDARREKAYALRLETIRALGNQRDSRATDSLFRTLPDQRKHHRGEVVTAILLCKGFSPEFQLETLEKFARSTLIEAKKEIDQNRSRVTEFERSEQFPKLKAVNDSSPSWVEDFDGGQGIGWGESVHSGPRSIKNFTFVEPGPFDSSEIIPLLQTALSGHFDPSESFLDILLNRILVIGQQEPLSALRLRQLSRNWYGREFDTFLLKSLAAGVIDIDSATNLLIRRKLIQNENVPALNKILASEYSESRAVAACVSEDSEEYNLILSSSEDAAKSALFACARLIRANLPLEKAAENITSKNSIVARAATAYLESVDSREAGRHIYGISQDQGWVLGSRKAFGRNSAPIIDNTLLRDLFVSTGISSSSINEEFFAEDSGQFEFVEEKLRRQMITEKDLISIHWYDQNQISVFQDRIEYIWADDIARYWTRTLTDSEYVNFLSILAESRSDNLPAFLGYCDNCEENQLISIDKTGGRRIYFSIGRIPEFAANMDRLFEGFRRTASNLHYWAEKRISSIEILFARENVEVLALKNEGGRYFAVLQDVPLAQRISRDVDGHSEEDRDNPLFDLSEMEWRKTEREKAMPLEAIGWYELTTAGIGSKVAAPARYDSIDDIILSSDDLPAHHDSEITLIPPSGRLSLSVTPGGLFIESGEKSELLREGWYSNPIITTESSAVLMLSKEQHVGSSLLLYNATGNIFSVIRPPEGFRTLFPAQYFPQIRKYLVLAGNNPMESAIQSGKDTGFFVDPHTGQLEEASPDLIELLKYDNQERQFTQDRKQKWAAIRRKHGTAIVHYDPVTFIHKEIFFVPWIRFTSDKMIVDDNGTSVRIVYNGHLLRIRLK